MGIFNFGFEDLNTNRHITTVNYHRGLKQYAEYTVNHLVHIFWRVLCRLGFCNHIISLVVGRSLNQMGAIGIQNFEKGCKVHVGGVGDTRGVKRVTKGVKRAQGE